MSGTPQDASPLSDRTADLIQDLEHRFEVNSLTFHDFYVWPYIRDLLIFGDGKERQQPPADESKGRQSKIFSIAGHKRFVNRYLEHFNQFEASSGLTFRPELPDKADVVLFTRYGERNVKRNAEWVHAIFDDMIDQFEADFSCIKVQFVRDDQPFEGPFRKPTISVDPSHYVSMLGLMEKYQNLIHRNRLGKLRAAIDRLNAFTRRYGDHFRLDPETVINRCGLLDAYSAFFENLLTIIRPKVVFAIGHSILCMALNKASKAAAIPSVDVQHGAAAYSAANIKWHGWKNIPAEGYQLLADYFWVWGEGAAAQIEGSLGGHVAKHRPVVGGVPWLAPRGADLPDELRNKVDAADKTILVCLHYLGLEPLPPHLFEAMGRSPQTWLWLVRLHPMDKDRERLKPQLLADLRAAGVANFEVDVASTLPLESLFPVCAHHLTPYSSAAIDATAFGVNSTFVHEKALHFFGDLIRSGSFDVAYDAQTLLRSITRAKPAPRSLVCTDPGAPRRALAQIIGGRG